MGFGGNEPKDEREPLRLEDLTTAATEASRAAERLTVMLEQTNDLLGSPHLESRIDELDRATAGLVDHVFWHGVWLVALVFVGLAVLRIVPRRPVAERRRKSA